MNRKMRDKLIGFLVASVVIITGIGLAAQSAYATNGYFAHGYSVDSEALGGAGVALPLDSLDAAVNPANMVFVGKRYDVVLAYFNPNREYTVMGNPSGVPGTFGLAPGTVKSGSTGFVIPSLGANWMLNADSSLGVSIYGNGGMNTDYPTNTFGGSTPTGVDLSQLFIAISYSRKIAEKHAVGIAPIFAYQTFQAKGLQNFSGFSSDPNNLTNNGPDDSFGFGAKIGYQGEVLPSLNVGLSYQTRTYMSKFSKYRGLFAEQGGFDIPSTWTVGLAYKATPALTAVFDVQRINYSDVKAIHNPMLPNLAPGSLGQDNGPGFGWNDMTIYKVGLQWQSSKEWAWRLGYSNGSQPIPNSEVLFNILAPGVIEQHATIGVTRATGNNQDLNFAVSRAFSHTISGSNSLEVPGQQTVQLKMDQWLIAVGYSWKY